VPEDNTAPAPQFQVVAGGRPAAAAVKFFRIRDFNQFQHYKDRNPRWVKLHGEQLEDYEFQQLPDATKFHALALTYLASRTQNKIPNDPGWVAAKIGATEPVNLALLWEAGFLEPWQPRPQEPGPGVQMELREEGAARANPDGETGSGGASEVLALCYQDASKVLAQNRTETETEAETHTEADRAPASAGRVCECCGVCVFSEFSFQDAFATVSRWKAEGRRVGGRLIENAGGLARALHKEGTADAEIALLVHPPPKREFTQEPCPTCFGTKVQTVEGRGARPCPDCLDEQGRRTGRKPQEGNLDGRVDDG
jgi:hypothetical protein